MEKKLISILKETTKKNSFFSYQNLFESFTSPGNNWITQAKACPMKQELLTAF